MKVYTWYPNENTYLHKKRRMKNKPNHVMRVSCDALSVKSIIWTVQTCVCFKLLYIFHICGKEWYIYIYIYIHISLFTDTLQLTFKTLQKLKLSSPISKVSTGKASAVLCCEVFGFARNCCSPGTSYC